jgi:GDPmannose 4,6-dehydratase
MLQQPEPSDFVIGTGCQHSVGDFARLCFDEVGLDPADFIRLDPKRLRPAEVDTLLADPTKAREQLGWTPRTSLEELARMMVAADLEAQERTSGRRRGGPGTR